MSSPVETLKAEEKEVSPLRENLVDTAVKFLQNPKVQETSVAQKKSFLENKGLTKDEIDAAIARSGTFANTQVAPLHAPVVYQPVALPPPDSGWRKAKDYAATAILVGGVGYAMYVIYKKYIMPVWFGPSKEEQHLADINASIRELQGSIAETLKVIQDMQGGMKKQSDSIEALAVADSAAKGNTDYRKLMETQATNEIKEELKSLKGLLLTRKQFPSAPKPPAIPSWQLEAKSDVPKSDDLNAEDSKAEDSKPEETNGMTNLMVNGGDEEATTPKENATE